MTKYRAHGANLAISQMIKYWVHGVNLALCFVLFGLAHTLKVTFGPLKATVRLVWPPVKMSLTPLIHTISEGCEYFIGGFQSW